MEFVISVLVFILINVIFLPYHNLIPKRHLKNLVGQINDEEIQPSILTATNIMERLFKYTEKYYKFIKNKISYEIYNKYSRDVIVAGLGDRVTPEGVLSSKFFLAISLMIYIAISGILFGISFFIIISPIAAVIGYIYPDAFIKSKIRARQWLIQKELPSVLNTMAIITDAGLGLFESIEKVCEIRDGEFVRELRKVNEEVKVGVLRKDAFLRLSERCEVNEVSSFVSALLQLLEKGAAGISKFLKDQSSELWEKRINHARELGAKASIKLFLPMLLLVLPATVIFLAGPVVISLIQKFL